MGSLLSMSGLGLFYIITLLAEPIVILITLGFLIYLKEKTIINKYKLLNNYTKKTSLGYIDSI